MIITRFALRMNDPAEPKDQAGMPGPRGLIT